MNVFKKHQRQIKKQNKRYSLMEYFLEDKPLNECSKECQNYIGRLTND